MSHHQRLNKNNSLICLQLANVLVVKLAAARPSDKSQQRLITGLQVDQRYIYLFKKFEPLIVTETNDAINC